MLKVVDLVKNFDTTLVLKGITHTFKEGKTTVILGSSGSGKSTFLRCLNFLEIPTSGAVCYQDTIITEKNAISVRKEVGMVFQQFNLFHNKTVLNNITYALDVHKVNSKSDNIKKAKALLKRVGLSDKEKAYPKQLSGGQKQRVAIARALAMNPKVFLFDEPTSALDPEMVKEVLDVMREIATSKITNILVTHEVSFAKEIADEVIFMHEGKIIETGPANHFFNAPKTKEATQYLKTIL